MLRGSVKLSKNPEAYRKPVLAVTNVLRRNHIFSFTERSRCLSLLRLETALAGHSAGAIAALQRSLDRTLVLSCTAHELVRWGPFRHLIHRAE
jgi:hypothetical protein